MTNAKQSDIDRHGIFPPLCTTAIVIYATLALLVAAIPQSPSNWLREMKSSEVQEKLLRGAETLQSLLERAGFATPYRRSREHFLALKGSEDN
jgi:hypothetical protein